MGINVARLLTISDWRLINYYRFFLISFIFILWIFFSFFFPGIVPAYELEIVMCGITSYLVFFLHSALLPFPSKIIDVWHFHSIDQAMIF